MDRLGRDPEEEIRHEIDHYLEERARELEAGGMAPAEARKKALEAFGDRRRIERETLREDRRGRPGGGPWRAVGQDVRFAVRGLRKRPGFAAAVLLTVALGIGANTAVYSAAEAVFLQTPPIGDPGSVVAVYTTCRDGHPRCSSSYPDYLDYRDGSGLLEDLAARSSISYAVADEGLPTTLLTTWLVTGNYFPLLGVRPAAGRLLTPADHDPRAPVPVGVLAFDTWRSRYGADPSVVGRTIRVHSVPVEIVGVAPRGFRGVDLTGDPQLFLPMATGALMGVHAVAEPGVFESRGFRWIGVLVGRLRPGAGTAALGNELAALSIALNEAWPEDRGDRSATVVPAGRYLLPQYEREALTGMMSILGGVVLLTLGLACANVANLLLARATSRRREMGVRVALGASRWRILRQGLTEGLVLALAGAVLGLVFAGALLEVLTR
ncbi:MAG TPA: ABC transporter permease, partial [Longimicrobiales bacterium]|nr:ABC transporter permease [Longimicrobiales bacterium]